MTVDSEGGSIFKRWKGVSFQPVLTDERHLERKPTGTAGGRHLREPNRQDL
jgi:hypothetical protein